MPLLLSIAHIFASKKNVYVEFTKKKLQYLAEKYIAIVIISLGYVWNIGKYASNLSWNLGILS
ncbi:hypothetical protein THERMOT_1289 [Bathymodiolus thermophilus thioautotrophic gill symbiont]|nr:hypothetical protein THERMOT_1289 [Bathymodiolus thermophilus thioautotrophic gill symbiont]